MSKRIPLTRGQFAIVDDRDFEWLSQWKWCAKWDSSTRDFRAVRQTWVNGRRKMFYMSREIMGASKGLHVDHCNHDGLDNRRSNLRVCTYSENLRNRSGLQSNNRSGLMGVYWDKRRCKWRTQVQLNGRKHSMGRFDSKEEAAQARDAMAKRLHGEFATLNGGAK